MRVAYRNASPQDIAELPASLARRRDGSSSVLAFGLLAAGAVLGSMAYFTIRRMWQNSDKTASAVAAARSEPELRPEESSFRVVAKQEPRAETVMKNGGPAAAQPEPEMRRHR